jgi:hypothetical protein
MGRIEQEAGAGLFCVPWRRVVRHGDGVAPGPATAVAAIKGTIALIRFAKRWWSGRRTDIAEESAPAGDKAG